VASVALAHGLNANLLHKWIKAAKGEETRLAIVRPERNLAVPVRIAPVAAEPDKEIRLDIRRGGLAVQMAWPREEIEALGRLLEGLLR
jgi:transposase